MRLIRVCPNGVAKNIFDVPSFFMLVYLSQHDIQSLRGFPCLVKLSKLKPAEVLAVKSQVKSVSSVWFERQRIKLWEEEDKIGDVIGFSLATSQLVDGILYRGSIHSYVERRRWDHYNMAIKYWLAFYLGSILALRAHKRMRLFPDTNRKVVKSVLGFSQSVEHSIDKTHRNFFLYAMKAWHNQPEKKLFLWKK